MSGRRPVVWAVVRDLGRTGVPIALTRLATWPGTREAIDLHVVARTDGPLRADLERARVPAVALEPAGARTVPAAVAAGAAHLGRPDAGSAIVGRAWRHRVRQLPRPDVVLVQGAGGWPVAEALHATDAPRVVLHLHELALGLHRSLTEAEQRRAFQLADRVLVVAEPVADLARSMGVPTERIMIAPGAVEVTAPLPRGRTDIVTIGEAGWRKGTDRAIAAAHELRRIAPQLRWHWVGRSPEPGWGFAHGSDVPVMFHSEADDPWGVVEAPAALVVPSREDPLPLVALEASIRGIPVVACAGSGGLDDLLADGRGWLVEPIDPTELATITAQVATGAANHRTDALRAHVAAHHRIELVASAWLSALTDATVTPDRLGS